MISVKNLRTEKPTKPWDVRVDRASVLGNPFYMKSEFERNYICDEYKTYFYAAMRADINCLTEIGRLISIYKHHGELNLFCWCTPKRCHAETIRDYIQAVMPQ